LKLVQNVLAQEREQRRLDALEAELASIRDPMEEIKRQADKAAFTLVYQADRFYRELNQTDSAVESYEQVIRLFPESRWADEARKRLAEIRTLRTNQI
jgi:outer membrane protein assembly factor BamD (BamD/ComL family)